MPLEIPAPLTGRRSAIRTRNTITIASQYPNRHIQIVLRLYRSVSEILTGFDVDCAAFAYDGSRVLASPRALTACIAQCNDIDLGRRSPSYENRLAKYARRGFEVYCDFLDRSRIDPTIFERSFSRTRGLARLLVLETFPKQPERESYQQFRRREMGRPEPRKQSSKPVDYRNKKEIFADDVAEWDFEDISNYQRFTIPYGPGYSVRRYLPLIFLVSPPLPPPSPLYSSAVTEGLIGNGREAESRGFSSARTWS